MEQKGIPKDRQVRKGRNGGTLTSYKKGVSGNPKGRKKSQLTKLGELVSLEFQIKLDREDKYKIIEKLLESTPTELSQLAKDRSQPAFMVMLAKAILRDIKNGSMNSMDFILSRIYGKPKTTNAIELPPNTAIRIEMVNFTPPISNENDIKHEI